MTNFPLSRRSLLRASGFLAAGGVLSHSLGQAEAQTMSGNSSHPNSSSTDKDGRSDFPLSFNEDGRFTIVQFNDTQDDHLTDKRTIEFMNKVLDQEKADFALINGDVITSGPTNAEQVYQALNNVVLPMENRQIPWAITFGNHDEDSAEEDNTGVYEKQMADFVRRYKYNLNPPVGDKDYGHSDVQLLIGSSHKAGNSKNNSQSARFAIWLLDSGNYLPDSIKEKTGEEIPDYDYIRPQQIEWYLSHSREAEKRYGRKIPGLMFFHIPTYEHRDMWFGGPANHESSTHAAAKKKYAIDGVKNEDVYYAAFNSGIYSAVRDRGDILGIYCGHDHINSYKGDYFGVELGYCPGTGFAPYGLHDGTYMQHTLRGARVFQLNENSDSIYESTRLLFAKDMGADMAPAKQPITKPYPFPEYIKIS